VSTRIAVFGTGYLGATHAACMAELGHEVLGVDVDPAKLAALSEGRPPFFEPGLPELLRRTVELGLAHLLDDGRIRIPDARFLDVGAELVDLGVPVDVVLDEWERLSRQTDEVAERFVRVFEDHLLPRDWRRDLDDDRVRQLAGTLARLQRNAGQVLQAALDQSVAQVAGRRLADLVPPDDEGGNPPGGG
jgi:glycine/D-amino acid oxidase-like deaminating enzyme